MPALFITGTDTGVGKTFLSYLLVKELLKRGVRVGYWKPIETGADPEPADAALLASLLKVDPPSLVSYTFKEPLAPAVAAERTGVLIDLDLLKREFYDRLSAVEFLIVEGAGGLAVPIFETFTYADFASLLRLPTVAVARAGLGTINCSVLTANYARAKGVNLRGFVLNRFTGADPSEEDNPRVIETLTSLPVLAKIPEGGGGDQAAELLSRLGF